MTTKKFLTLFCASIIALSAVAKAPSILSLKAAKSDTTVLFPESFATDTEKMMQNWYLKNYAVLDADVEKRATGEVSEAEYIRRLKNIPTTIEMPYNAVVRQYIDAYVNRRRTLVEAMLGMSLYYMPIFEQALEREGLPLELKYLPVIESALNPDAVSRVGATGLWQFMIPTAKGLGLEVNTLVDERRDPYRSSDKAAVYLKQLYNIYKDWSLAIAAYNCGPNNVNKAIVRAGGGKKDYWAVYNYLPKETRGYFPAFIAATYVMTYFKEHNISPSLAKKPLVVDTIGVSHRVHFEQISKVLNMPIDELKVLNPQFRQSIIPGDARTYTIALPSQQVYSFIMSEDSIANYRLDIYGRRDVVQPGYVEQEINGDYTYETREVVRYHKVGKNETLAKVAKKYGVSASSIKADNGLRSSKLKRGQRLKIITTQRVKVPVKNSKETESEGPDSEEVEEAEEVMAEEVVEETPNVTPTPAKSAATKSQTEKRKKDNSGTHVVKSGESLFSIATENGISVDALKHVNNLRDNNIQVGQRLVIPESEEAAYATGSAQKKADAKQRKSEGTTYTVKRGDNLAIIARNHGVTVDDIMEANGMSNNRINAGQELTIPGEGGGSVSKKDAGKKSASTTYKVKRGDNLATIARNHGVTVDDIMEANGMSNNRIDVGQELTIPAKSAGKTSKKEPKAITHTVKSGETLDAIARKHGTTVAAIKKANGMKKDAIGIGQKLTIPAK